MDRVARQGPANASPWRAKRGDTSEIVNIFVAVEGGTLWRKNKFSKKKSHSAEKQKGDPLGFFNIHSVAKHQKIEGRKFFIFGKNNAEKKLKGGTFRDFSTSILSQNSKKNGEAPFGEKKFRKVSQCRKKIERVSPGMVCYAGKQEKPFWFSSLGQMVQFGAIIFCRTFNYFGQFVWIEKKEKSL